MPAPCIQPATCGPDGIGTLHPEDGLCPDGPEAPAAPVITTQMVTEAAKVTAPVSPPHVEPGNRSYVNIPNNYWTDAPHGEHLDHPARAADPAALDADQHHWSFGDGATATGNGVKGADVGAADALEHSYTRQGSYDISTTTNYDLTFVLPGRRHPDGPAGLAAQPARDPPGQRDPDPRRLRPLSHARLRSGARLPVVKEQASTRGRRPGAPDTRAEILASARSLFAARGFPGTSVRAVAAGAGVDPALVHHYFGTKDDLFVAALEFPVDPRVALAPVFEGGVDGAGERLLRVFLSVWDDESARLPLLGLVRGAVDPHGARLLRDGLFGVVLGPVGDGARARPAA